MSLDFRNDLRELFIVILLASVAFFLAYNCEAQRYPQTLTLDMLVHRTPLNDSISVEQSLSYRTHETKTTVERVRLTQLNRDVMILLTATDTLELEYTSVFTNCNFTDRRNPKQVYFVSRERINRGKSFYFTFVPYRPLTRPNMYVIRIEPYLPYSSRN